VRRGATKTVLLIDQTSDPAEGNRINLLGVSQSGSPFERAEYYRERAAKLRENG